MLHVLNELRPSGAETMLRLAGPIWNSAGYQCDILSTGQDVGPYAEALRSAGYQVHHLAARKNPAYFVEFANLVRRGGYDVVHQHAEGMRYWFCLAALAVGAKVAATVHSNFSFDGSLRWRRAWQRRHLQRLGVAFIAIAPGVRANEARRFGIESRLVWNWFDSEKFRPVTSEERMLARRSFGLSDHDKVVVSLGNCSEVKNHAALLGALTHMPGVKYLHVGQEDHQCSEQRLAKEVGLSSRVHFLGWLDDPRTALAASDVYVMPSLFEGLGVAALEAIGSGLPCVLSRAPGLVDLASLGLTLEYADATPEALAKVITTVLDRGGFESGAADANAQMVIKRLSPAEGGAAYAKIWSDLACSS
ncbi:hypothetical protein N800_04470 [Lysobacter daejeonensis GH1-9]|uniref:Glycosyltransferase subfamily 4-like N-terminal domain-containing protein n=1 Tax=Lysobacter daejeonensis GH1-9 TaxID=1385517 RepID=A0A0A0EVS6_9GAMM|nr:hypothetical protein N800_04470 [Lysobacter daejeonensis GH1-9]